MGIDRKYGRVTFEKGTIGEDEPVVVFRAQDKLLIPLLWEYYDKSYENCSPQEALGRYRRKHEGCSRMAGQEPLTNSSE